MNRGLVVLSNESNISIFPNPSKETFNIRTDISNIKIEVYSILGKLITEKHIYNGSGYINLNNQAKGIYFARIIYNNGQIEQRKLIVK